MSSMGSNGGLIAAVEGFREPDSCYQEMDSKRTEEMESAEITTPGEGYHARGTCMIPFSELKAS